MPITYDIATDLGRVRFAIGDTVDGAGVKPDSSNFSDEELSALLADEGSVAGAVAAALETLARLWAGVVNITVGPRSESLSDAAKQYAAAAVSARARATVVVADSVTATSGSTASVSTVVVW